MYSLIKTVIVEHNSTITINDAKIDIPSRAYERLAELLDEKDIAIQDKEKLIAEWKVKYKEIEKRLVARSGDDKLIAKANEKLSNGDFDGAEKLLEQSFKQDLKKNQIADNKLAQSSYELGLVKELKLEYKNALFYFEKACEYNPENGVYLNQLGLIFITLGKYKKAVEYLEKALNSGLKTYGDEHPDVARDWNNLGSVWRFLGKYKKAIEYYEKALNSDLKTYGPEHPAVAKVWNNLGLTWQSLGKYKKAVEYLEKALNSDLKTYGPEHPAVARDWNNFGEAWEALGKYEKAIENYEQALEINLIIYGQESIKVAIIWNNLGNTWGKIGDYKKAYNYFQMSFNILKKELGDNHSYTIKTKQNLNVIIKKIKIQK